MFLFNYVCWVWVMPPQHACRDQRTSFRSAFSPSTIWVLGTELRLSDLVASPFTCWAISVVLLQYYSFFRYWDAVKTPCFFFLLSIWASFSAVKLLNNDTRIPYALWGIAYFFSKCCTYWYSPQKITSSLKTWKDVKYYFFAASICNLHL